jgi:hypothetical protein
METVGNADFLSEPSTYKVPGATRTSIARELEDDRL